MRQPVLSTLMTIICLASLPAYGQQVLPTGIDIPKEILFIDDFNGTSNLPNPEVWTLCTPEKNAWAQHFEQVKGYENVRVEDGVLKLKACKADSVYKNGGIRTLMGFHAHSRLEVKARLNKLVRGGFPAIWQMPINGEAWPRSGEIDLMEWVQESPNQIYQTVHTAYLLETTGKTGATDPNPDKAFDATAYHVYAAERTTEAVIFYIDGKETWRYENKHLEKDSLQFPFCNYPYDIILNYSLGGMVNGEMSWPGEICDDDLPGEMWIDWVRIVALKPNN